MGNSKETESLEPPRGTPIEVVSHRYPRIPREEETTLLLHEKQKPLRKKTRYLAQEQQEGWSLFQVVKLTLTTFFVCSTVLFISRFVFMYNLVHYTMPEQDAIELLKVLPSSESIRAFFHQSASMTHLAGTANDKAHAEWIRDKFIEFGIADTTIETYWPLLNYPLQRRLAIVEGPQELLYEASLHEPPLGPETTSDSVPTFHGYSWNGNVTGPVVYAHYGRIKDFQFLASKGVNFTGAIALMRNGRLSRGLKIKAAESFGCIGALLYSDPFDDGPFNKTTENGEPAQPYPLGPWRPSTSVERGTVHYLSIHPGDPLTPGYPATETASRLALNETTAMPRIPSLPISWADAQPLLKATENYGVQSVTQGDVKYFSGPSQALINLVNINEYKITSISNVIGRIPGKQEPDRIVIIGNHRDAWGYGAADPSSGTAVMMEIARVFGMMLERGWRPRRTIILASWDAEEYGTVGSTEWVEDHKTWLQDQAIAYINVDTAVTGPHFSARSSPLLNQLLYEVTDQVVDPRTSQTVLEAWKKQQEQKRHTEDDDLAYPLASPLGAGSDFVAFMDHAGISSMTMSFRGDSYGVYHSNYDSIYWMEAFGDPTFEYHTTLARIWGLATFRLANDMLLPMQPLDYANELSRYASHISSKQGCLALPDLSAAVAAFQERAIRFDKMLRRCRHQLDVKKHYSKKLKKHVAQANERLYQLERAFIDSEGLPGRPWYKHVVYAPGLWTGYSVQVFPAITEAMQGDDPKFTREMEERAAKRVGNALRLLRGQ